MAGEKVLVADDEPFILRSLSFVLERAGFRVLQARNGDEALERLRDGRPRICILDVMMPRRSGYEVCEVVKGDPELRDTYVVLLTAKGQEAARARGLKAGADDFMTKPFSPSRLVARIREVLDQPLPPLPAEPANVTANVTAEVQVRPAESHAEEAHKGSAG